MFVLFRQPFITSRMKKNFGQTNFWSWRIDFLSDNEYDFEIGRNDRNLKIIPCAPRLESLLPVSQLQASIFPLIQNVDELDQIESGSGK